MTSTRPREALTAAVEHFREYVRRQALADRAEQRMLAAVAELARDGTVEERAEYVRRTQQILDDQERTKR